MSVAVCKSSAAGFESILALSAATISAPDRRTWLQAPAENEHEYEKQQLDLITKTQEEEEEYVYVNDDQEAERPPGQFDIWSSFQPQKAKQEAPRADEPYVHPLMRRSSNRLSQKSLEICTESLGSETGSYEFFSSNDETDFLGTKKEQVQLQQEQDEQADEEEEEEFDQVAKRIISSGAANGKKELTTVNYHSSISRRSPKPRSFPPPLPSISRRNGPCLQMRPHRLDGRLVVEAVPVPSQHYLHAKRQNGRLLLSFINTTFSYTAPDTSAAAEPARQTQAQLEKEEAIDELKEEEAQVQAEELEDEEVMMEVEADEEEEVEVVDRGTVVEVKVSTNPQQNSSGAAAVKVHRSSIVINKFVSMPAVDNQTNDNPNQIFTAAAPPLSPVRRVSTTTTTAAAAAVAASSLSAFPSADGSHSSTTDKLLFTSRRRNREELLHDMKRCSQLRQPLFILEPCCIATSS